METLSTGCIKQRSPTLTRLALLASLVLFGLVACQPHDSQWDHIIERGVLLVGMDASFPPFENIAPDGSPDGFDVDFATEITHRLSLKVEFVNIAYDGLYDALAVGRVDVLISALNVQNGQLGRVAYSDPYFNAGETLVVPVGSEIADMADMDGKLLAVEYGSGGDVQARAWQRRLGALEIMRMPDAEQAINAVEAGAAHAALVDGISARIGVAERPALTLGHIVEDMLFVAAVRIENDQLQDKLNAVINEMLSDGTIGALTEKWFQAAIKSDLPRPPTPGPSDRHTGRVGGSTGFRPTAP